MLDINPYLSGEFTPNTKGIEIAKKLQVHSKGLYPADILDADRPNEDPIYKAYRKSRFKPITKAQWNRASAATDKIVMAEDWAIVFPESKGAIRPGESLEEYTQKNYPYFDSIPNWYFSLAKKTGEGDPNLIIAVFPLSFNFTDQDYCKPFAHLFPVECEVGFVEGEFCAILTKEKSWLGAGKTRRQTGNVFIFMDRMSFVKATQVGEEKEGRYDIFEYQHNIGHMPAWRHGGPIEEFENNQPLYNSFFAPMVPYFDEAIARYSDHQVNMILHLHPDRWEIATSSCKPCKGSGEVSDPRKPDSNVKMTCGTCGGVGKLSIKSPFGVTTVPNATKENPTDFQSVPTPPMGYANRPIESIAFLKEEVKDNIQAGFESVHLGLLNHIPAINSGIAKQYDRQEPSAFFRNVGRHTVENILRPVYFFMNEWRYPLLTPEQRQANLPKINIPTKFDILTSDMLAERLKMAIDSNFSPSIINSLQIEYAEKELGKDHEEVKKMKAISELDPLPNLTITEKSELMLNPSASGTSVENYILSVNLSAFVARAINESKDFLDLDYGKQKAKLMEYVAEIKPAQVELTPIFNRGEAA